MVRLINCPLDVHHHYHVMISDIKEMLARDWEVILTHVVCEANFSADFLAKAGSTGVQDKLVW